MTTVLSACTDLCVRIGHPQPTRIIGANGEREATYLALLVESCRDLARRFDWEALKHDAQFDTVAGESQALITEIAPGYRKIVPDTFVNVTTGHLMTPINSREAATQLLSPATFLGRGYRIVRGRILMPGNSAVGQDCRFEYHSNLAYMDSAGANFADLPERDDDIVLLDDECIILSMKWRWRRDRGLSYGEEFNDFERCVGEAVGRDGGEKPKVSLNTIQARRGYSGLGALTVPSP
jgi:hypothetical protein